MAGSLTCSELSARLVGAAAEVNLMRAALERERATSRKALELVLEQAFVIQRLQEVGSKMAANYDHRNVLERLANFLNAHEGGKESAVQR